jgi:hypothetical protein
LRRAAGLAVVAGLAGGHNVLPIVATSPMAGQNVVQRKVACLLAAVLTGESVAEEDIATGEASGWAGSADEVDEPDYGRDLEDGGWTVKIAATVLNDFGLSAVDQNESPPDVADVQRLVVLI